MCTSSCFDIQERVYLKKNGSGTYSFTLDFSQSKTLFEIIDRASGKEAKGKSDLKITEGYADIKEKLDQIDGLNNLKFNSDTVNYTYEVVFDFANISVLNEAIGNFFKSDGQNQEDIFQLSKNKFVRQGTKGPLEEEMTAKEDLEDDTRKWDPSVLFGDITYQSEYRFDRPVKSVKNKNSKIGIDGRSVELKVPLFGKEGEEPDFSNVITF